VAILECYRTGEGSPNLRQNLNLPFPSSIWKKSNRLADISFDSSGRQIAVVTDIGKWFVFDISRSKANAHSRASGLLTSRPSGETPSEWWKIVWMDDGDNLLIGESQAIYLINIDV
jgi:RNA polymerase I-specific transcription-initiation factor